MSPNRSKIERISALERQYVGEVLNSNFRTSGGSTMCTRLEKTFAEKIGVKYAISFINGTATMHAALAAAGVGPGHEVIVPPLTMGSTTLSVLQVGAVPVFADIDPETFLIDPESIATRVTEFTKAIIPVSLYGLSPDMDTIDEMSSRHGLTVVEDDAQAFLGTYKGRFVGTMGHASSFSFQSSKHLTSGEGGIITTNDDDLATKIRRFNSLGYAGVSGGQAKITKSDIQDPNYARHVSVGYNYRMPELCAAVALAQVERADELVNRRVEVARLFQDVVQRCDWLRLQMTPEYCLNTFWTFAVKLIHPDISWHNFRDKFHDFGGDGIYAAWRLTYLEPMFTNGCPVRHPDYMGNYQRYGKGLCPIAETVQPQLLQFKTNYWDWESAEQQADILRKTIRYFS